MRSKSRGSHSLRFLVSHARKTTILQDLQNARIIDFQELFIWLAREHYFSRLLGALGGSWRLLGDPRSAGIWEVLFGVSNQYFEESYSRSRRYNFLDTMHHCFFYSVIPYVSKYCFHYMILFFSTSVTYLLSDHRLFCHLLVGPPTAYVDCGGSKIAMCPHKNISKVIAP